MQLMSIIGTRPQYIKIKPFYDYCLSQRVSHFVVDTLQHYSPNVSSVFIKEFGLDIDYTLRVENTHELMFISESIVKLGDLIQTQKPDMVLVYGDTNSTLCAALAAYKLGFPIAHIEAGVRGFHPIPEEINRTFADSVSALKFCSSPQSTANLKDGIYIGDLEYELLNTLNPEIRHENYGVMTIHRQDNMSSDKLAHIFNFCELSPIPIKFFVHHRTANLLKIIKLKIPANLELLEPCSYNEMVTHLSRCSFIISDSGSIQKTAPFFGKKMLVMRTEGMEWVETEQKGYAKKYSFVDSDSTMESDWHWLLKHEGLSPDPQFYGGTGRTSAEIITYISEYLGVPREEEK